MEYLCENGILTGDAAIDAYGWAEERRETLELRKKERAALKPRNEELVLMKLVSTVDLLTEAVLLLKCVIGLLVVLCLLLIQQK